MNKIESFKIDHTRLLAGIYVSLRQNFGGQDITTFDIRLLRPNIDPVMSTAVAHAIEHLGATYLRNRSDFGDKVVYFGPMGCRTGFYLVAAGRLCPKCVWNVLTDTFKFIADFEGDIPGASPVECGNYSDMDLAAAKELALSFYTNVLLDPKEENMNYPK